ncbi:MAG: hypothetical protein JSS81_15595 [Acidobacteria bacterium]|nr:hypothetical protein [Acidobacteriota bacterium]
MKNQILTLMIILGAALGVAAQKTFLLTKASKTYDLKVTIEKCEDDTCEGPATVYLLRKGDEKAFQTIRMENLFLELGTDQKPTANLIELYGENNSGVIFEDYNFDGIEDLALRNGNFGNYGGPSYDVLLFSKKKRQFVLNDPLTVLASENLGMFDVDPIRKTIETFAKSGCCWHERTRYKIVNDRPVKVYVLTEDVPPGDGTIVILTTRTLVNGKWKKKVKRVPTKDYYKDQ